jgi:hypothetical protein
METGRTSRREAGDVSAFEGLKVLIWEEGGRRSEGLGFVATTQVRLLGEQSGWLHDTQSASDGNYRQIWAAGRLETATRMGFRVKRVKTKISRCLLYSSLYPTTVLCYSNAMD